MLAEPYSKKAIFLMHTSTGSSPPSYVIYDCSPLPQPDLVSCIADGGRATGIEMPRALPNGKT